nr:choice-of-anchor Q domain-containing protein [uncultured Dyadobacter sp.]
MMIQSGGRGGSGFSGGGAGSSTTTYNEAFSGIENMTIPTGGAGGTGSAFSFARAKKYPFNADAGPNNYFSGLENVSISPRTSTAAPQSGYIMYRTVKDAVPPVIAVGEVTVNLGNGKQYPFYSFTTPLNMDVLAAYIGKQDGIYDDGGIKSVTFSRPELNCSMVGESVPVDITVTDFAGNSTNGSIIITVRDPFKPVATMEQSPDIWDSGLLSRINVTQGPYALTAANFPKAFDGCQSSTVVTHFTPTTFDCSHAGTPQAVSYYYIDRDGNRSPDYTKTFNIVYTPTSRLYVDHTATGANNGSSWADAFTSLQDALQYGCAAGERELYVAKGTYYPHQSNRNASFTLRANDKLYGGFPNGGGEFASRNPKANPVILSGEIATASLSDNIYHVVTIGGSNTLLEGFTVRDGYANENEGVGGGALVLRQTEGSLQESHRTTIRNCVFLNNYGNSGGAVYTDHRNSSLFNYLFFQNCLFEENKSAGNGGAVYLSNQHVSGNMKQEFVNCVFHKNSATGKGGALHAQPNAGVKVVNCTYAYNEAVSGGGAIHSQGSLTLLNSILYFDTAGGAANEIENAGSFQAAYSNIQGSGGSGAWALSAVTDQGQNLDADPLFYQPLPNEVLPALTLSLQSSSRNSGHNAHNSEPYDISGYNVRISQNIVDMGAYETNSVVYVAADAPAGGDGHTWGTALNNLNEGILAAGTGQMQRDIWVKEGIYRPDRTGAGAPTPGSRTNTFFLNYNLKIYGGFAGNETSIAQRKAGIYQTILSGDIGAASNASDNVYHVITANAGHSRLDGLIIEGGNADGEGGNSNGAGLLEYPAGNANTMVVNCVFRNNHATGNGGAVYVAVEGSYAVGNFVQCVFYGNKAARGAASFVRMGGVKADYYDQNFYHTTATGNTSSESGAGAFEADEFMTSQPVRIRFSNSLLAGNLPENINDAGNPGNISLSGTYAAASSTGIFTNSSFPAGADGKIMTADDGLQLLSSSPAIGYGDNANVYNGTEKDLTGSQRIVGNVDAGAYESTFNAPLRPVNGIIYVKQEAAGTGSGNNWDNATADLHNAIHVTGVQKVFVSIGHYKVGDHSFIMKNGVAIYGGFDPANGITDLSHKRTMPDPSNGQGSVLDGENVRPVIWNIFAPGTALDNTAVLDGFTITKGRHADGAGIRNVYASPTLRNLVVRNNSATTTGGGILNFRSSPLLTNVLIGANAVGNPVVGATVSGAGISNVDGSEPVLTNVTITGNVLVALLGSMKGAGIYNNGASPKIHNSIIWGNRKLDNAAATGADIENEGSVNLTLKYSITQDYNTGSAADHNKVRVDPQMTDGYRPAATSPAVDSGNNSLYAGLAAGSTDLMGNPRVNRLTEGGIIDMGAYESTRSITRWYVNASQLNAQQDGTSWAHAFARFEDGVAAARAGDSVWVAKGTYSPAAGASLGMKTGVRIYGGFAGTEQAPADRNLALGNNAILRGNGASVMANDGVENGALLDGFVIQGGNAASRGGGVLNVNTHAAFRNIVLAHNSAPEGGGLANVNSNIKIENAVFYANQATQSGGAIYDNASETVVLHATFTGNSAQNGSVAARQDGSSVTIGNSISWDNAPGEWHSAGAASTAGITNSLLQSAQNGAGNLSGADPKFGYPDNPAGFDGLWFTADDGLTATEPSVFVNKGDNTLSAGISNDITGAARVQHGIADMGAYESASLDFCAQVAASGQSKLYVNANGPTGGNGLSWNSPLKTLTEALEIVNACNAIDSVLIAEGTYFPTGGQATGDRTRSFVISRGNVHMSGGFSGTSPGTKNIALYKTILSGNINNDALADDNSFHVVTLNNPDGDVSFDGLTISGGTADGSEASDQTGGGIFSNAMAGSLKISNCILTQNAAVQGGAIDHRNASLHLMNVVMTGNSASSKGSGIRSTSGNLTLTNVTLAGNAGGSALDISGGSLALYNSIVFGTITGAYTAHYSLVEGNTDLANGNINAAGTGPEQIFGNAEYGDFTLKSCGPAIHAGTPDAGALGLPAYDVSGQQRIFGDRIDVGAYENTQVAANPGIVSSAGTIVRSQRANGATTYLDACNALALTVTTTGAPENISGSTTATVWLDASQNKQYVKRHFQIVPPGGADGATGRVKLYFTQQEFDAFNAVNTIKLPTGPGDSQGIAQLLVEKRGGASSDGSGVPTSYPGPAETIDPADTDVLWNTENGRWEVSFNVSGFSGFFIKTTDSPLPVRWISFTASLDDRNEAVLEWKVDQVQVAGYQIERSSNAKDFLSVATIAGTGDGIARYSFTDPVAVTGTIYYRIRQIDHDGSFSYSRTVSLRGPEGLQLMAYPNPTSGKVTVRVDAAYIGTRLRLVNAAGKEMQHLKVSEEQLVLDFDQYPAGTYMLYTFDRKVLKIIRY